MRKRIPAVLVLISIIALSFHCGCLTKIFKKEPDIWDLDLAGLLKLKIIPAVRENLWKIMVRLTLRCYSGNLLLPCEKKIISLATDSDQFMDELFLLCNVYEYGIKGKPVEGCLVDKYSQPADLTQVNLAFIRDPVLAKRIAAMGNILVFSNNPDCSAAAFVIFLEGKHLAVKYREKNILAQGALFSPEFFAEISKKPKKKENSH